MTRAGETDGVANLDGGSNGARLHGCAAGESVCKAAIERVGSCCLDCGDTWQVSDQAELVGLQKGFADGRGVTQVAGGQDQPVGSLPVELLQEFKTDGFL